MSQLLRRVALSVRAGVDVRTIWSKEAERGSPTHRQQVTTVNERVADGISRNGGVLMHGPTFMANPLACSIANASIDLLTGQDWARQVDTIAGQLDRELSAYREHPNVADVRVLGAIGVVELDRIDDREALKRRLVEAGVWVRPFGNVVYLTPALTVAPDELDTLMRAVVTVLRAQRP